MKDILIKKVEFCKLKECHLELIRKWRNSLDVSKYMYTNDFINFNRQKKWFNQIKKDKTKRFWIIKRDGKYIGVVNLYNIDKRNKRCYWAYYIAYPSMRGKGIGRLIELNVLKYVFDVLELNKLCATVLSFNEIVIKIHKKYGFKIEGYFRQYVFKDGIFQDVVCMSILKKEWKEIEKSFNFNIIEIENYKVI